MEERDQNRGVTSDDKMVHEEERRSKFVVTLAKFPTSYSLLRVCVYTTLVSSIGRREHYPFGFLHLQFVAGSGVAKLASRLGVARRRRFRSKKKGREVEGSHVLPRGDNTTQLARSLFRLLVLRTTTPSSPYLSRSSLAH